MNSIPNYYAHQWIIIGGDDAFAKVVNAHEKPEGGWVYRIEIDGNPSGSVDEENILAGLENGKWVKRSISTAQSVYL